MSPGPASVDDDRARLHLIVSGRVQGVFFRHSAMEEAHQLALSGWVRNLASGEVEIIAEGRRKNLEIFFAWAHSGPPGARVADVREEWSEYRGEFGGFRVR
jgi:acylphosphatase